MTTSWFLLHKNDLRHWSCEGLSVVNWIFAVRKYNFRIMMVGYQSMWAKRERGNIRSPLIPLSISITLHVPRSLDPLTALRPPSPPYFGTPARLPLRFRSLDFWSAPLQLPLYPVTPFITMRVQCLGALESPLWVYKLNALHARSQPRIDHQVGLCQHKNIETVAQWVTPSRRQGSFRAGTHRNAVPVLFLITGTPFRSFSAYSCKI